MAERRMFAKTIVLSDAFLDMPMSARCLYFTLGMLADDDGFINSPKSIMRQCGASLDDMNLLLAKKFLIAFDDGVVVIKHWRIHNYIQADRYVPTKCKEQKALLEFDENKAYKAVYPECIQDVSRVDTQVRLGKDSIGKVIDICANEADKSDHEEAFNRFWDAYPKKKDKAKAELAFKKAIKKTTLDAMLSALNKQKQSKEWQNENGQYIPFPTTWLNGERWNDEFAVESKPIDYGEGGMQGW